MLLIATVILLAATESAPGPEGAPSSKDLKVKAASETATVDLWDALSSAKACQKANDQAVRAHRMADIGKAPICEEGTIARLTNSTSLEGLEPDETCGKEMTHVKVTSGKHQGKVGCLWSDFVEAR